jgi:hypothetical protein
MRSTRETRRIVGLALAVALNAALCVVFSQAMRQVRLTPATPSPSYLLLLNRPRAPRLSPPPAPGIPQAPALVRPFAARLEMDQPPPATLTVPDTAPATDWRDASSRAAQALLTREQFEKQQGRKIGGALPLSNFDASRGVFEKQRPLFTPGHQPISRWFDATIDEETKLPMLTLGPCHVALIWVLPTFGCAFGSGHDPAEEDSFDLHQRSRPIEVPVPLITVPEPQLQSPEMTSRRADRTSLPVP